MAGVIREVDAVKYHELFNSVHKSMNYMATAEDIDRDVGPYDISGCTHLDAGRGVYTGRTQVLSKGDRSWLPMILCDELPMVINTSFNTHGTPMVLTFRDAVINHQNMVRNDLACKVHTYFIA
jgi:predicted NodU family carbamoyl transferase